MYLSLHAITIFFCGENISTLLRISSTQHGIINSSADAAH